MRSEVGDIFAKRVLTSVKTTWFILDLFLILFFLGSICASSLVSPFMITADDISPLFELHLNSCHCHCKCENYLHQAQLHLTYSYSGSKCESKREFTQ